MGAFLNQNSLLLSVIFLEIIAGWFFLRSGLTIPNFIRLLVVTAVIAAGFFGIRPTLITGGETDDILANIGQGRPVLLEFKSPN